MKTKIKFYIFFIILSIFSILVDLIFPLSFFKEKSLKILLPITSFSQITSLNLKNFWIQLLETQKIYQENRILKEENNELKGNKSLIESLKEENDLLRQQALVNNEKKISNVLASVIGREESNSRGIIILNKGENDGITEKMPVIIDNRLIGVVIEVFESSCRVKLINSSDSKIPVKILGDESNGSLSFLEGSFGLKMSLNKVDQDAKIITGDLVITSGQGGTLPGNMLVGEIIEVSQKVETMIYQEAKVEPVVRFEDIDKVFIFLKTEF